MTTVSPIRMLKTGESKNWLTNANPVTFSAPFSPSSNLEGFTKFLKENGVLEEQTRMAMTPTRSGSAPPTVEGSIAALRTFMGQNSPSLTNPSTQFSDSDSEEFMRSDPSYIAYYYANVNLNPRLPPPLKSQENCHLLRHIRDVGSKKVPVAQGLLATHKEEPEEDMSSHLTSSDQNQTELDHIKGDFSQAINPAQGQNRHVIDTASTADKNSTRPEQSSSYINVPGDVHTLHSRNNPETVSSSQNADLEDDVSTRSNDGSDISVAESRMKSLDVSAGSVTKDNHRRPDNIHFHDQNTRFQAIGAQTHVIPQGMYGLNPKLSSPFMQNPGFVPPLYASTSAYMNAPNLVHPGLLPAGLPNPQFSGLHHPPFAGYVQNDAHPLQMSFIKPPMESFPGEINPYRTQVMYQTKPYIPNAFVFRHFNSPLQGRYFQPNIQEAQAVAQQKEAEVACLRGYKDLSHPPSGNIPSSINGGNIAVNYYGYPPNSYYGYPPSLGVPHVPVASPAVIASPISGINHPVLGKDGWKGQIGSGSSDDCKRNTFLELLKSSSSKKLELSDISGQIVEFSTDQHGSRFIQQKLEHCSSNEKDSVFKEVLPHASRLMTDVFGNYVIQKFFEHGTLEHRQQLGEQLTGQVLSLSLQMYGCRVIQKALEVIELDQKVSLVQELDGHVMRCVHDQNGNHVIQKCIESVPTEKVKFIISSFYGQVAALSSHPYGCRVIQRVLEHCSDEQISRSISDEILDSACTLAQDPYGNYVTQHILEMGKPQERSQIIQKLTGKFIEMSQLKFASNVVEKCLKYGDAAEQDLIIEEFIAESDNNDTLLMLMKDQFANYVVQKIFDIGTEKQKEAFLNCIKTHLPVLKRYTYAKQIVARYEQLTDTEGSAKDQT